MKALVGWINGGLVAVAAIALNGCSSASKYQMADAVTPPATLLNAPFSSAPLRASLATVIGQHGPGSWKRDALWDEYVVVLRNATGEPITLSAASLEDSASFARTSREDPWKLENESAELTGKFRHPLDDFLDFAEPPALMAGAALTWSSYSHWAQKTLRARFRSLPRWTREGAAVSLSAPGRSWVGFSRAAMGVGVPLMVVERIVTDRENRADIEAEFRFRRLPLPMTLAPGQARAGALFFPLGVRPRTLKLQWRRGAETGETVLSLEALSGKEESGPRLAQNSLP